jgi:hypothetical protein
MPQTSSAPRTILFLVIALFLTTNQSRLAPTKAQDMPKKPSPHTPFYFSFANDTF